MTQRTTDNDPMVQWVGSDAELADACARWQQVTVLAIDTEFVRRNTFYPVPALLQCCDGTSVSIIDPLAIVDWQPLVQVLNDQRVVKVMHACSEDLEVFWRLLSVMPAPLFDTQLAAGLCGMRPMMGYHKLVAELLHCDLPKDQTQSDWLLRPLSADQLRYAVNDVSYLYDVYQLLLTRCRQLQREQWVLQESAAIGDVLSTRIEPDESYQRIKGIWRLSPQELAVARVLCSWREQQARHLDKPRNWIIKDAAVMALAQRQPATAAALADIDGLAPATLRKHTQLLLQLVNQALALPPPQWPPVQPKYNAPALKKPLALLQQGINDCAQRLGIAPELLLSRRQQEAVLARWADPEATALVLPVSCDSPWRAELLEPTLRRMESA